MNTSDTRPDGIFANDLGHELVLYDSEEREALVLNLTARFVWMLCGERHSIADIARALVESFDHVDFDTAKRDVEVLLDAHARLRCLKNAGDRLDEPVKASGQKPRYITPAVQKIAQEQFIKQSQRLGEPLDPIQFGDSWEGCGGDAAT